MNEGELSSSILYNCLVLPGLSRYVSFFGQALIIELLEYLVYVKSITDGIRIRKFVWRIQLCCVLNPRLLNQCVGVSLIHNKMQN